MADAAVGVLALDIEVGGGLALAAAEPGTGFDTMRRIFFAEMSPNLVFHSFCNPFFVTYTVCWLHVCLTRYSEVTFGRLAGDTFGCLLSRPLTARRPF
jgi:hypothetical protein